MQNLRDMWRAQYQVVPQQLAKVAEVHNVTTAFNTNIDAVIKLSGAKISGLADALEVTYESALGPQTQLLTPQDVMRGIVKCFVQGIAEEWLTEDKAVYAWMRQNLGYDRLQMGGQAGIVANAAAVAGAQKVVVHTASHPAAQASCFLNLPNLLAIDGAGELQKASEVVRADDEPLVHWIIEFDKDDEITLGGKVYRCPKANRFIATYDAANLNLQINPHFVAAVERDGYDYLVLSGYHNLTAAHGGLARIADNVSLLQSWKERFPKGIVHLELASTQDKVIRAALIEQIAPLADSLGLNEREALDALEVIDVELFARYQKQKLHADTLFDILQILKQKMRTPRVQLHMFGLYMTLQDKGYVIKPAQNKNGMMVAATAAASKAATGAIDSRENLLWAHGQNVGAQSVEELHRLALHIDSGTLETTGMASVGAYDLIAVPTIIVERPKTLVGMGDTISSLSLVAAR